MTSRERFDHCRLPRPASDGTVRVSWAAWSARDAEVKRLVGALRDWKRAQDYAAQYGHLSDAAQAITDAYADAEARRDAILKEYADD